MAAAYYGDHPHKAAALEEGMPWPRSDVGDEASVRRRIHPKLHRRHYKLPTVQAQHLQLKSNYIFRPVHRAKYGSSGGEPRMQAFFLNSGQRPSGTGVFLPQTSATNDQPGKRQACASVLLPSRGVQALNLNVHALGLQISPRREAKNNSRDENCNLVKNKNIGKESSAKCCVISPDQQSCSAEILLPKEWSY